MERNQTVLPVAQFNLTARQEVFKITVFFSLAKHLVRPPHLSSCTRSNTRWTFDLRTELNISWQRALFHAALLGIHGCLSSGCWSGRTEAWRSSTWPKRMKADTPALLRTTGGRPTARDTCRSQVTSFWNYKCPFFFHVISRDVFRAACCLWLMRLSAGNQRRHSEPLQTLLTSSCLLLMNCSLDQGELTDWQRGGC